MNREDAKDLTLSILVVVAALLLADCIWLHVKCSRLEANVAALTERVELHINPPKVEEPTLSEKAKQALMKVKAAAEKGYDAAKRELAK